MSDIDPTVPVTNRLNFGQTKAPVEQADETVQAEVMAAEAEATPEATVELGDEPDAQPAGWNGIPPGGLAGDPDYMSARDDETQVAPVEADAGPFTEPTVAGGEVSEVISEPEVIEEVTSSNDDAVVSPTDEADAVEETAVALADTRPEVIAEEPVEATPAPVIKPTTTASAKTTDELQADADALLAEIKARTDAEKATVLEQVKTITESYGITTWEIVNYLGGLPNPRKGEKAPPKYKDKNSSKTWTGRGKAPSWIKGQNYADFAI